MSDRPIYTDGFTHQLRDMDPAETQEWLDALDEIVEVDGDTRARYLMARLLEHAREHNFGVPGSVSTPYINTIPPNAEPAYPGDEYLEKRIRRFIRWNAAAMVIRANKKADGIGGICRRLRPLPCCTKSGSITSSVARRSPQPP